VAVHTIDLTVTDDDSATDSDSVQVTVNAHVNQAPTADAGPDQNVIDSDDSGSEDVTLDGSASSDSDGAIVSYEWEEASVPIASGVSPVVSLGVAAHTIDLTVTDDDSATDSDSVAITVEEWSVTSSTAWQTFQIANQTGQFEFAFDMVPNNDLMDAVTGVGAIPGAWWSDLACIVRIAAAGVIDVRNGGAYAADAVLNYSAGTKYGVRMVINVPAHTYDVYVTPEGQSEVQLADDYAFRTEQAAITNIEYWTLNATNAGESHTVSNVTVTAGTNIPPTADAGPDQNVTDSDDNGSEDVTLDGSGSSDSDGTITVYDWEESSVPIATGVGPTVSLSVAVHTIDLIVTDDDSDTDSDSVVITVNPYVNVPPTADAGPDQNVTDTDDSGDEDVTLDGSGSSDSDGTITVYDWEESSVPIATGVGPTVTLSVAVHTIDLIVTDDDDATDSDSVLIDVQAPSVGEAAFIVGSTSLGAGDAAVQSTLVAMGYTVIVIDDGACSASDANGKALVVISATVKDRTVGGTFRDVTVPVLLWEHGIYDEMNMATSKGTQNKQTQADIVDAAHPMAAGLSGTVTVYASKDYTTWAVPTAAADVVATVRGDASKAVLFGYEAGDVMVSSFVAPAKRVGVFVDADSASKLTADGQALFEAAVNWAVGQ